MAPDPLRHSRCLGMQYQSIAEEVAPQPVEPLLRAGLADGVVESIAAAAPERVAYVSCNPATWARDVARFESQGYRLTSVQPVDMFPQTYHVEVVSVFERL